MPTFADVMTDFRAAQDRYSSFGAADSEPSQVMYGLLEQLLDARSVEVPASAGGWALFEDMAGVGRAATALAAAARKVIAAARQDLEAAARYIRY